MLTNKDAPLEKIITVDIADPKFIPKDLVPEQKDSKLEVATLVKDYIVIVYKKDVRDFSPGDEGYGNDEPSVTGQRRDLYPQPQGWETNHSTRSRFRRECRDMGQERAPLVLLHAHELYQSFAPLPVPFRRRP